VCLTLSGLSERLKMPCFGMSRSGVELEVRADLSTPFGTRIVTVTLEPAAGSATAATKGAADPAVGRDCQGPVSGLGYSYLHHSGRDMLSSCSDPATTELRLQLTEDGSSRFRSQRRLRKFAQSLDRATHCLWGCFELTNAERDTATNRTGRHDGERDGFLLYKPDRLSEWLILLDEINCLRSQVLQREARS